MLGLFQDELKESTKSSVFPFVWSPSFLSCACGSVVYEHRSRLEKSLQKERLEHKKAKEGEQNTTCFLHCYKLQIPLHATHQWLQNVFSTFDIQSPNQGWVSNREALGSIFRVFSMMVSLEPTTSQAQGRHHH